MKKSLEYSEGVKPISRWHDVPNGSGVIIVEAENQEALTAYIMGWSAQCTYPTITPVMNDGDARKDVKAMIAAQQG
jgi:hypothetical protein